jgi:hypothetical protein
MKIADRIIEHIFDGDGASRVTPRNGVDAYEYMKRAGGVRDYAALRDDDRDVLSFKDGSEIEWCGPGFDTPEGWEANR